MLWILGVWINPTGSLGFPVECVGSGGSKGLNSCRKVPKKSKCLISLVLSRQLCLRLTPSDRTTSGSYLAPHLAFSWHVNPVVPGSLPHHPTPRYVLQPFSIVLQHVTTSQCHLLKLLASFFPLSFSYGALSSSRHWSNLKLFWTGVLYWCYIFSNE